MVSRSEHSRIAKRWNTQLRRAIQLSNVVTLALAPDSEIADCDEASKHENATSYERRLSHEIFGTEEDRDEPGARRDESGSIFWLLTWRNVHS